MTLYTIKALALIAAAILAIIWADAEIERDKRRKRK